MPATLLRHGRFGRSHFRLADQVAFLRGHGEQVIVFPVLQCPCLIQAEAVSPICSLCDGTGRFYPPEAPYATSMLLVHEQSSRSLNEPGTWIPGTMQATTLPDIRLAHRDKIRRLMQREVFSDEVLVRGGPERLRLSGSVQLELVYDSDGHRYRLGVDVTLTPPNQLTWLPGGQHPADAQQYSVRYLANPDYLVAPARPRQRQEGGIGQSQVVMLHRLDMLGEDF